MKRTKYYLPFVPKAKVNYLFLLELADIAEYNPDTKQFDSISYSSIDNLTKQINVAYDDTEKLGVSTVYNYLRKPAYNDFLQYDSQRKQIILKTNVIQSKEPFVVLTEQEVKTIRDSKQLSYNERNLFFRYFCYLKYYIGYSRNKQTDSTAEQILLALGYSATANNYKSLLSVFNGIIAENKLLKIERHRDNRGFIRNTYSFR